jgi:hypothetical protein
MKNMLALLLLIAFSQANAHQSSSAYPVTLYRNSVLDRLMRIHVATFNTDGGYQYNWENCVLAASLFQSQPGVKTYFWCEPGDYKK